VVTIVTFLVCNQIYKRPTADDAKDQIPLRDAAATLEGMNASRESIQLNTIDGHIFNTLEIQSLQSAKLRSIGTREEDNLVLEDVNFDSKSKEEKLDRQISIKEEQAK
jgi:hypothetical protein